MPIDAYRQPTDTYRQPVDILTDAHRRQPIDMQVTTDEKTHGEKRNINLISFLAKIPGDLSVSFIIVKSTWFYFFASNLYIKRV